MKWILMTQHKTQILLEIDDKHVAVNVVPNHSASRTIEKLMKTSLQDLRKIGHSSFFFLISKKVSWN